MARMLLFFLTFCSSATLCIMNGFSLLSRFALMWADGLAFHHPVNAAFTLAVGVAALVCGCENLSTLVTVTLDAEDDPGGELLPYLFESSPKWSDATEDLELFQPASPMTETMWNQDLIPNKLMALLSHTECQAIALRDYEEAQRAANQATAIRAIHQNLKSLLTQELAAAEEKDYDRAQKLRDEQAPIERMLKSLLLAEFSKISASVVPELYPVNLPAPSAPNDEELFCQTEKENCLPPPAYHGTRYTEMQVQVTSPNHDYDNSAEVQC